MDFPEPGYRGSLKKFNRDPNGNGTFTDSAGFQSQKKQTSKKQSKANVKPSQPRSAPRKLSEPTDNATTGELTMLLKAGAASYHVLAVAGRCANHCQRTSWVTRQLMDLC